MQLALDAGVAAEDIGTPAEPAEIAAARRLEDLPITLTGIILRHTATAPASLHAIKKSARAATEAAVIVKAILRETLLNESVGIVRRELHELRDALISYLREMKVDERLLEHGKRIAQQRAALSKGHKLGAEKQRERALAVNQPLIKEARDLRAKNPRLSVNEIARRLAKKSDRSARAIENVLRASGALRRR